MANLLLQPLIKLVMQKATDSLVQRLVEMWGVNDQRERLCHLLLRVQDVLTDAENQGASKPGVKNWMLKLRSAAYDADDVLDELQYEELRRDAVKHGHKVQNGVSVFFSHNNPAVFRYNISEKLKKVVRRIEELVAEMAIFGFVQGQHVQAVNRVKTDSFLFESNVVGRDGDKEKIVKLLVERPESAELMVVPVVGMGGLGKTTLIQLVLEDPRVKEHFRPIIWVCVSEESDINVLVKLIIDTAIGGDCKIPDNNMELLRRHLHQTLSGKRYLLVLDDVWNAGDWERLGAMLNCGASGSAIIVTTRNDRVALIMGTMQSYNLECLSEDDSWNLFKSRAFSRGVEECQELVEISKKMAKNCRGLPLAIKSLSSLMSDKHEVQKWLEMLKKSNTWELPVKNDVLPVLRLSYDDLLPHMKQCFAFCAVFPKDYEINKEQLIQFWMANGFIPSSESGSLEMEGDVIFNELCWRSFFQEVRQFVPHTLRTFSYEPEDGYLSQTKCKMHDLIHDLAVNITTGECLSQFKIPTQQNKSEINVRHISLKDIPSNSNKIIDYFPSIRSVISSSSKYDVSKVASIRFLKPNALRILKLGEINPIQRTSIAPEMMTHLRYLEISDLGIKSLPEAISTLYLLQTLRLSECFHLQKLPNGMRYMRSLRHLYLEECFRLESMPSGLGQLSCLQTLTTYIISSDYGNSIAELKKLDLCGKLHIYNLRELRDVADAREANLKAKKNLDDLLLCWGTPRDYNVIRYREKKSHSLEGIPCNPFEVLDALKPSNNLTVLGVALYGSDKFPVWMTEYRMLEKLIELRIIECKNCTKIPPVEKLPFLQILELKHLDKLSHLYNNASTGIACGENVQIVFPSLKQLELSEMPNLCSWCEGEVSTETSLAFLKLKRLEIINCPMLTSMPTVPSLEKLSVAGNRALSCFAIRLTTLKMLDLSIGSHDREAECATESFYFQPWESLEDLSLTGYNSIVRNGENKEEVSVTTTKCRYLSLSSCNLFLSHIPSNSSFWFWNCFTFLEYLSIWRCDSLIYWPEEEFRSLNFLTEIFVFRCPNFLGSQQESQAGRSNTEVLLPKLQSLFIGKCMILEEIPKCSTYLRSLRIESCPKLQCISEWLGSMIALKYLIIENCGSFNTLPLNTGSLSCLQSLKLDGCLNLACLPEGMEGLAALDTLGIKKCPKIRSLPDGLLDRLKTLDELWIEGCPHLERHFQRGGKYHRLISEIRNPIIGDGSSCGILRNLTMSVPSCKITCFSTES